MTEARPGEEGVIAVVFAICAAMLLGVAALGVDLGNAFARERMTQSQADYAALAAGPDLPVASITPVATDTAVLDVAKYLIANAVPDDSGAPLPALATLAADLVSTDPATMARYGHVYYGAFVNGALVPSKDQLTVTTPGAQVDFGLAKVMGFNDTHVASRATVQVFSPVLNNTLPLYAAQNCSFGSQTLAQPSNGLAASAINLANGTDTNSAVLTGLVTLPASLPSAAAVASPYSATTSLTIAGTGFTGATAVGFFESGTTAAGPAPVVVDLTKANPDGTVPVVTAVAITGVELPQTPQLAQDTWYVRVKIGGQWSPVSLGNGKTTTNALPLTVGAPTLTCQQGSSAGNFGSLALPNPDGPNNQTDNIAYNIIHNLKHTLAIYKGASSPWTCTAATSGAVVWGTSGTDGTNCVDTKTGNVAADAAYEGLIAGVGSDRGRLQNVATGTGCGSDGKPATTVLNGVTINNDTLSCFLTNTSTTLGDVTASAYTGPRVFSPAIFNSPRFVFVPVLGMTPTVGGSNLYQIVGFRAGFITSQAASATQGTPLDSCTTLDCNGLTLSSNGNSLNSVQIMFINDAALPPLPDLPDVATYSGSGQRVFRLID